MSPEKIPTPNPAERTGWKEKGRRILKAVGISAPRRVSVEAAKQADSAEVPPVLPPKLEVKTGIYTTPEGVEEIWDAGKLLSRQFLKGPQAGRHEIYNREGKLTSERLPDGTRKEYRSNGALYRVDYTDGRQQDFDEKGNLNREKLADGTVNNYYENGVLGRIEYPDGRQQDFDEKGIIARERLLDGSYKRYENGIFVSHVLEESFDAKGMLIGEKLLDGSRKQYDNGILVSHTWSDRTEFYDREDGHIWLIQYQGGNTVEFRRNGTKELEQFPDGSTVYYDEAGEVLRRIDGRGRDVPAVDSPESFPVDQSYTGLAQREMLAHRREETGEAKESAEKAKMVAKIREKIQKAKANPVRPAPGKGSDMLSKLRDRLKK